MRQATAKSEWKAGQDVVGVYCGKHFDGKLNEFCRATPDGRNVIFGITLGAAIEVFGKSRERIEIQSGDSNTLYLV